MVWDVCEIDFWQICVSGLLFGFGLSGLIGIIGYSVGKFLRFFKFASDD